MCWNYPFFTFVVFVTTVSGQILLLTCLEYDQSKKQGKPYKEKIYGFEAGIVLLIFQFQA